MAAIGLGTLETPGRRAIPQRPFLSGPAGYPQSGTRLIGTGLDGLLSVQPSIFIPENRPGRNPSLGG
jgi:hypothetical protein